MNRNSEARKTAVSGSRGAHYLDILDARMFDMEDALRGVAPGEFSDRIWVLDNRKIYKPTQE